MRPMKYKLVKRLIDYFEKLSITEMAEEANEFMFVNGKPESGGGEELPENKMENIKNFPKLPIYRSKGVWIEGDDGKRLHAITWAYKNWTSATENERKFIINAVAALFDFGLIQQCSEKCAIDGPCEECGHWEWVTDPLPSDQKYWMGGTHSVLPFGVKDLDEKLQLLNSPQHKYASGPGSRITKEAVRCAASMIVATKADFWCEGPAKLNELEKNEEDGAHSLSGRIKLGKNATSMLEHLYPEWNADDAAAAIVLAGKWANTRHILRMVGGTPIPKCIPLWGMVKPEMKLSLGPELEKSFKEFPAGTEVLLDLIQVAQMLLATPLVFYVENINDLKILKETEAAVKNEPHKFHVAASTLGVEPEDIARVYSVFGRLGSFYLSYKSDVEEEKWNKNKVVASQDFNERFENICRAYFGLLKPIEAATALLKAKPVADKTQLVNLLNDFGMNMTEVQEEISQ